MERSRDDIRVLLVDDHTVVRQALRALLLDTDGIDVIGEAGDGEQAVAESKRLVPDVVLMDVIMPRMDGAEATAAILAQQPGVRIVALSGTDVDERIFATLRAGAQGYVSKGASKDELVQAIRRVASGRASMPPEMTRRLLSRLQPPDPGYTPLTEREQEIVRMVAKGLSNRQIGTRLNISEATVRTHLSNLMAKMGIGNRVEATLYALRDGLATLEECLR